MSTFAIVLIIFSGIGALFFAFVLWCIARAGSRADDQLERMDREKRSL
jgi:hypothetical protein